jgi:hypothetical protein
MSFFLVGFKRRWRRQRGDGVLGGVVEWYGCGET